MRNKCRICSREITGNDATFENNAWYHNSCLEYPPSVAVSVPKSRIDLEEIERNKMTAQAFDTWKNMERENKWYSLGVAGKRSIPIAARPCPTCGSQNFEKAYFDSNWDYYRCRDCGWEEKTKRYSSAYQGIKKDKEPFLDTSKHRFKNFFVNTIPSKFELPEKLKNAIGIGTDIADIYGKTAKDTYRFFKEMPDTYCPKCKALTMVAEYKDSNDTETPNWYVCKICGHRKMAGLIKRHRNKLVNEYPKFVVMAIGILLFSFEIFTFGSGDYAGYYLPFVVGGILIGVSAWWLHYGRVKKEANREKELKETKETVNGKSESTEATPGAGISSYAARAAEIEKEDD